MRFLVIILRSLIFLTVFTFFSEAYANRCNPEDVDSLFSRFTVKNEHQIIAKVLKTRVSELCQNYPELAKLAGALKIIDETVSSKYWKFSQTPSQYLEQRVKEFNFLSARLSPACRNPYVGAYVVRRNLGKVILCKNNAITRMGALQLARVLIHEARHFDGPEFSHKKCHKGPYALIDRRGRKGSCDDSIEKMGSYGVETMFLLAVKRPEATELAISNLFTRFNQLPFGIRETALVQSHNGELFVEESGKFTKVADGYDGVLGVINNTPHVFQSNGRVKDFHFFKRSKTPISIFTSLFENGQLSGAKEDLLDVVYSSKMACILFKTSFDCFDGRAQKASYSLEKIKPKGFRKINNQVYLLDVENRAYLLPDNSQQLMRLTEEQFSQMGQEIVPEVLTPFKKRIHPFLWSETIEEIWQDFN